MRTLLFYDLPTETKKNVRDYNHFVRKLISEGFYRIQYSVFVKLSIDQQAADSSIARVKEILPKEGNVFAITITEKQFATMEILLGQSASEFENSDARVIEL